MSALSGIMEPHLFTIRRYDYGAKDALGRKSRTLLSETTSAGLLAQKTTVEGQTFVVDRCVATMPSGTDLRVDDEVEARGLLYVVDGTPDAVSVPGYASVGIVTAVLKYVGPVIS